VNRWRLVIAAAALIGAAVSTRPWLIPEAQAQATANSVCAECRAKQKELTDQEAEIKKLEAQLQAVVDRVQQITNAVFDRKGQTATAAESDELSKLNDQRKELEAKVSAARTAADKLRAELAKCPKEKCEPVPGSNASPADAPSSYPQPVAACHDCDRAAIEAHDKLNEVLKLEWEIAGEKQQVFELKEWLSDNIGDSNSSRYKRNEAGLERAERQLRDFESSLAPERKYFKDAMDKLDFCNANCEKRSASSPPPTSTFGPTQEAPSAKCSKCAGEALRLAADLLELRYWQSVQARFQEELDALTETASKAAPGKYATQFDGLRRMVAGFQATVTATEQKIAKDRDALDACNRSCDPKTTSQPDAGTKQPVTPAVQPPPPLPQSGLPSGTGGPNAPTVTPGQGTTPPPGPDKAPPPPPNALPRPAEPISTPGRDAIALAPQPPGVRLPADEESDEDSFTFVVPGDRAQVNSLLSTPFFRDKAPFVFPVEGGYEVSIDAGEVPVLSRNYLARLQAQGVINGLETDPCWRFEEDPAAAARSSAPAGGAWVLYTLLSPSPSFNPGEQPGDDHTPTITRVAGDGTHAPPPALGLPGPVEIRVAMGCIERTTTAVGGAPSSVPSGGLGPRLERFKGSAGADLHLDLDARTEPLPKQSRTMLPNNEIKTW
jgi:hypothetical protein